MHDPDQLYDVSRQRLTALHEQAQQHRYLREARASTNRLTTEKLTAEQFTTEQFTADRFILEVKRPDSWHGSLRFKLLLWFLKPLPKNEVVR